MKPETTIHDFAVEYCARRGLSKDYRQKILAAVKKYDAAAGRPAKLSDLTAGTLNKLLSQEHQTRTLGVVLQCRDMIAALWRDAQCCGLVDSWPVTRAGKLEIETCDRDDAGASITLDKFLMETFIPERLKHAPDGQTETRYRRAVELLDWCLGRDVVLADLTTETFQEFGEYLARHHYGRAISRQNLKLLYTLARYARARGLLTKIPDAALSHAKGAPTKLRPQTIPGSLAAFYWSTFRPKILAHADPATLAHHDKIVGHFGDFAGLSEHISGVTPTRLADFRAWLLDKGIAGNTAEGYLDTVGKIVANTTPEDLATPYRPEFASDDMLPPTKGSAMPLRTFLESVYFLERELSPSTRAQMANTIDQFEQWAGREVSLSDLTIANVNGYVAFMRTRYAAATTKNRRGYLLQLWNLAFEAEYLEVGPSRRVVRVKVPRKVPKAWTLAELRRIVDACRTLNGKFTTGIDRAAWMKATVLLAYDTGLRIGDVFRLRCDQLEKNGTLRLTIAKTGQEHLCRIRPETLQAIEATMANEGRELLLPPPHKRVLYEYWRRVLKAAGLPSGRHEAFHKIRRTSASYIERDHRGAAGDHLGHLTDGLARKCYVDPIIARPERPLPPSIGNEPMDAA